LQRKPVRTWLSAWLPTLIWGAVIWQLGSDGFSETQTRSFLRPRLEWLLPWLSPEALDGLIWTLRKAAHPSVYALLALLCWRGVDLSLDLKGLGRRWFLLTPVLGLALADESRQAGSALRSGATEDVILDLLGGILMLAVLGRLAVHWKSPLFRS
jgi:hypothetical protein